MELGPNIVLPTTPLPDHPLLTASSGSAPSPEKIDLSPAYKEIVAAVDAFGLPKGDAILQECSALFTAVSASLPPQTKALKPALLATVVAFRAARARHLNPSTFAITKHVQARGLEYRDFRDVLLQTAPLFPAPNASALVADSSREITLRLALPALVADGVEYLLRQRGLCDHRGRRGPEIPHPNHCGARGHCPVRHPPCHPRRHPAGGTRLPARLHAPGPGAPDYPLCWRDGPARAMGKIRVTGEKISTAGAS